MQKNFIILLLLFSVFQGCDKDSSPVSSDNSPENYYEDPVFDVKVAKWYNGKTAAISINYDAPWGRNEDVDSIGDEVLSRGLRMDHELVTYSYVDYPEIVTRMREEAIPSGIHFFGHGHKHDLHDNFDYEYCYNSFKTCYDFMKQWGLNPIAYAYPGSYAYQVKTQFANKQAGFICARGVELDLNLVYMCPDDVIEPVNWHYLPSVAMGTTSKSYIQNHSQLEPVLKTTLEKTAWIILLFHSIGFPNGYAYYPREEFIKNIDMIAEEDFWSGNMDRVACYIQERNNFILFIDEVSFSPDTYAYKVSFCDGLNNEIYDQPLTLDISFDYSANVRSMHIEPAVNGIKDFQVENNKLQMNIVPNEQKYYITLHKE